MSTEARSSLRCEVLAAGIWQPWETVPRDGTEVLVCTPGGNSDHFMVLRWDTDEEPPAWEARSYVHWRIPEEGMLNVHLGAVWAHLYHPPNSLCYGIGDGQV